MESMTKSITLNITAGGDTMDELLRLLAWMDICSEVGHNTKFDIEYLGDYSAHVRIACLEGRADYEQVKHELFEDYSFNCYEPKSFSM